MQSDIASGKYNPYVYVRLPRSQVMRKYVSNIDENIDLLFIVTTDRVSPLCHAMPRSIQLSNLS